MSTKKEINIEFLEQLYLDGVSIEKIAKKLNCSKPTVYRNIRKLGLPKRINNIKFDKNGKFLKKSLKDKFEGKYTKTDSCWLWTGSKCSNGYGIIQHNGKSLLAHRVAFELFIGKIPEGYCVCHKCDNQSCVNPEHLFIGTQKDNIRDCIAKGRKVNYDRHGERNPAAKLKLSQVEEIRRTYTPFVTPRKAIAKRYGVSVPLIDKILSGKVWQLELLYRKPLNHNCSTCAHGVLIYLEAHGSSAIEHTSKCSLSPERERDCIKNNFMQWQRRNQQCTSNFSG